MHAPINPSQPSDPTIRMPSPTAIDPLEQAVWRQVEAVLDNPHRVAAEHERRAAAARDGLARADVDGLERQMARLRRGMGRLIDSYAAEGIDPDEVRPPPTRRKPRPAR